MTTSTVRWASRLSFIFAASSASIGLGNIWRFPYLTGDNGGSAFVLVYLSFIILLGLPLIIAEMVIGRMGRGNPSQAIKHIAKQSHRSRWWGLVGGLTIITAFLILSYYIVIIGWVLDYFIRGLTGQFQHITESQAVNTFANLQSSHWRMLLESTGVVLATVGVIIFGVKRGLERAIMFMFPALLVLMVTLLIYAITTPGFHEGLLFLFSPDFSKLTGHTVLIALGQAFFSLNIAMAVTMMFSAYLPKESPIVSSAIAVTIADTGFALMAGLIIFPIVFTFHLPPNAGPSLIFETLPIAFGQLPFGTLIASVFFLLLFFAAFTSSIALIEPAVAWLMERWQLSRQKAVGLAGCACWVLSLGTILSFTQPKSFLWMGKTMYEWIDFITANILLPFGGIMIAVFVGWMIRASLFENTLRWSAQKTGFQLWQVMLRFFAPVAILLILLASFHVI